MKTLQEKRRVLIRKAYKPTASREYTDSEVDAEIERLEVGLVEDSLDDFSLHLGCQLSLVS